MLKLRTRSVGISLTLESVLICAAFAAFAAAFAHSPRRQEQRGPKAPPVNTGGRVNALRLSLCDISSDAVHVNRGGCDQEEGLLLQKTLASTERHAFTSRLLCKNQSSCYPPHN